ncbi:MAG: T9SS type A sorting domain-containing protein [Flavobacteriales bacterium]|nr:T9SS type A sorting domain-containing protein [Flavobacteriales bacterium]MCB9190328.1 T9SS type A sorting domain-containing protein [Flavobacteriales bacterium]
MKHLLLATLIAAFGLNALAQQTGDYTITIATTDPLLSGDSLDIYFHVPNTYTSSIPSKMILGFHGLGNPNNSDQIRNYLSPLGDSLNAVVVCPDPYLQDQPRSEIVLNLAYDSVMTWFNIDTNQIYITGYSAGSDVAAQYVFGEPTHRMKGFIWHSPGFFSSPDLSNPQEIPPVCLCSGTVDFVSIVQANILNGSMSNAGFPYLYNQIPGVDHTMEYPAFTQEMMECINFIDANSSGLGVSEWTGSRVSMYPNPLTENQELVLIGLEGDLNISVLDASGKMVWSKRLKNVANRITISDFRNGLAVGLYTVSILSESGSLTKRLVVR